MSLWVSRVWPCSQPIRCGRRIVGRADRGRLCTKAVALTAVGGYADALEAGRISLLCCQ